VAVVVAVSDDHSEEVVPEDDHSIRRNVVTNVVSEVTSPENADVGEVVDALVGKYPFLLSIVLNTFLGAQVSN
jgi:hypothetical protein